MSFEWIDPWAELDWLRELLTRERAEHREELIDTRHQYGDRIAPLTRMNDQKVQALTELMQYQINPPIILKERSVIGEGLIVLPIKGSDK